MNAFKLTAAELRDAIAQFLIDEGKIIQPEGNMDLIPTEDGGMDVLIYPKKVN